MSQVFEILAALNPAQRQAVQTIAGPVLILAGPGSGKTRVIAHRIAYLILAADVPPHRILAVTFTNKAAREMRDRVAGLVGEQTVQQITMGTFHSVCARILRTDGHHIGIDRGFAIYDENDQIEMVRRALQDLDIDPRRQSPRAILSAISRAKSELISPEVYARRVDTYFQEVVARVYRRYQEMLTDNGALDFDDLLVQTVELLSNDAETREKYRRRYLHILIDEFQDTNIAQYMLAQLLAGGHSNICVVGDPDQSIYSWRSADLRNILNFERDFPNATVIFLEQNYRSTQTILEAAQQVIKRNQMRKEKRLWTENEKGVPVTGYEAYDEIEEAAFVANQIEALVARGQYQPGAIAVMYRTNAQSRVMEEVLVRRGIPYRLVGGTRFYERKEVKDVLAYLRLLHNPNDSLSLARIINVPARGIGQRTIDELLRWSRSLEVSPLAALGHLSDETVRHRFASRAVSALRGFYSLQDELRSKAQHLTLPELIDEVLSRIDYRGYLAEQFEDGEERWENVRELLTVAAQYEGLAPGEAMAAFLAEVALVADVDEYEAATDAVTLITLHQAKGLEFPVVFITGLEEGLLPHIRSYDDPAQMEEERRLCYVGMTRARERLYLVWAFQRSFAGRSGHNPVSRFVKDIPSRLLTAPAAALAASVAGRVDEEVKVANTTTPQFAPGEHVRHARFGEGIVISCDPRGGDQELVVAFAGDAGVKKLLLSLAPIERIL